MTSIVPVSIQDKVNFTKSLSVMLKSGISINDALTMLAEQATTKKFAGVIYRLRDNIEGGTLLSVAFEKEEKTFGPVFVSLIKAGEESGTLQDNLQFLSEWFERNADLRREVSSATLYPKLVFSAAVLLGGSLAVFILPRLVPLFNQLNVELPLVTKILLSIALFIESYWFLVVIGLAALIFLFILLNRIVFIQKTLHHIYITMPFTGELIKNYQLALITQLFGTLLKSGLTLNDSIHIVKSAATNIHYRESLVAMEERIVSGTTLSKSLAEYETLYPKMMANVLGVGEESGTLSESFEYLQEYYTKEVNAQTKRLPTIIEPLLLIFIATVVGFVALAIIMPIYKLTGSITV